MIVVLVYRPEAVSGAGLGERPHEEDPFEGVDVFGLYHEGQEKQANDLIDKARLENPGWKFCIDPKVKWSVFG